MSQTAKPGNAQAGQGRFATVQRTDMVATVLKSLMDNILAGSFGHDGELPSEGELAESFQVSRTVIREAMRGLRAYGLVEVSQGRAPRVKPADTQTAINTLTTLLQRGGGTLLHLIEVRRPLEGEIAALAAERGRPDQCAQLEELIGSLGQAATLEAQIEMDGRFHRTLAEMAGNPIFGLLLDTISGLLHESRLRTIQHSGVAIVARHHGEILAAVRRRDVPASRTAMLEHLRFAEHDLREEIANPGRPPRKKPDR